MNEAKKLMDDIISGKIPVRIGLVQQGHIPIIEKMLRDNKNWYEISKTIGWDEKTTKGHYYNYALTRGRTFGVKGNIRKAVVISRENDLVKWSFLNE